MKNTLFTLLAALSIFSVSTQSHAGSVELTIGEYTYLPDCGGTVEVNNGGNDNQLNVVFRNVSNCSIFQNYQGKVYRLQGSGGSYTAITAQQVEPGEYKARVFLYNDSQLVVEAIDIRFIRQ